MVAETGSDYVLSGLLLPSCVSCLFSPQSLEVQRRALDHTGGARLSLLTQAEMKPEVGAHPQELKGA